MSVIREKRERRKMNSKKKYQLVLFYDAIVFFSPPFPFPFFFFEKEIVKKSKSYKSLMRNKKNIR